MKMVSICFRFFLHLCPALGYADFDRGFFKNPRKEGREVHRQGIAQRIIRYSYVWGIQNSWRINLEVVGP
jgi:hypothetical protein